jgi:hypothetical protein
MQYGRRGYGYGFGFLGFGFGSPYCFDGMSCGFYGGDFGGGLGYYPGGYYGGAVASYGGDAALATDGDGSVDIGGDYVYVAPPDDSSADAAAAPAGPATILYFKDGSSYGISDYWLEDGRLHYVTTYGGANGTDLDRVDLQRTVDENAKAGVTFTLRPGTASPADSTAPKP